MFRKYLVVILYVIGLSHAISQEVSQIKGVIKFVFQKDTVGYNRFWLTDQTLGGSLIIPDIKSVIDQLILGCEIADISYQSEVSYEALPEFKNKDVEEGVPIPIQVVISITI